MANVFCLLNHKLTEKQIFELQEKYTANKIIYPSDELSSKWSQIPACEKLDKSLISELINWLASAEKGDFLIIQGEFGFTFLLVDYALKNQLIPLHAVTKRVAMEERNGELVSRHYIFEHVCFRKYEYYKSIMKRNLL